MDWHRSHARAMSSSATSPGRDGRIVRNVTGRGFAATAQIGDRGSQPLPDSTAHEHRAADPETARKLREERGELVRRIEDQAPGVVTDCHRETPLIRHPRSVRQGG